MGILRHDRSGSGGWGFRDRAPRRYVCSPNRYIRNTRHIVLYLLHPSRQHVWSAFCIVYRCNNRYVFGIDFLWSCFVFPYWLSAVKIRSILGTVVGYGSFGPLGQNIHLRSAPCRIVPMFPIGAVGMSGQ